MLFGYNRPETAMLVFHRKKEEKIIIGNEIEVQVLAIRGGQVQIGIRAPQHISVYRNEVYEAIKRENEAAVRSQIPDATVLKSVMSKLVKK